ncbi:extracellular solute-binding protein [Paenibacillus oryzisoli]|uniref:ABC transporter substrate-binding protein n=1 Tax=Paenibacillus oryzisoli TaxID=1850517 RepID=UPI003D2D7822
MNSSFRCISVNLILTGVLASCLAGCDRQSDNVQIDGQQAAAQVKSLTLAVQSYADEKTLESLLDRFRETHPGYEVKLLNLPKDRYDEFLNMRMTSGEGPDVFQLATGWLAAYTDKNYLLDLSKVVDESVLKKFPEWAVNYSMDKGDRIYAIPSDVMTLRLIYNKDLLKYAGLNPDVPPQTLQELRSYANKISDAGTGYRKYGFALPAGDDETFRKAMEIAGTYSGVYYYNFADGRYDFSGYEPWFQTMSAMKKEGGLFPGETSLQTDTALAQFAEGNIGMMLVTNHDFAMLGRVKPLQFAWGVAMPPLLDKSGRGQGALMEYPEPPFVINAYTAHKTESVELWKFLQSPDFLGALYQQGDAIPTQAGITADPQYRPLLPQFSAFLPTSEESPYPREPKFILKNFPTLFSPKNLGDAMRMKAYREVMQGVHSPEEVLGSLTAQYNESLEIAIGQQLVNMHDFVDPSFDFRFPLKKKVIEN